MSTTMSEQQWQSGLARVRMVVGWVGRGGASTCVGVDPEDPRGLSPVAVRRLVYQCAAEMVKLPATFANTHMVRLGEVDGRQRVRCPIFTEAGKSQLALDLLVGCDAYGDPSVDLERVVDTRTGLVLLTEHEAPARDCPKRGQPVPGTGEDPRTRRDARIDDSNLVDQICGRIEQAHGNTGINSSQASTGQQVVYALVCGYSEASEHLPLYTFVEDHPEWIRELIWAARHVGAYAHADYLDHALDVVATHRWNDPDLEYLAIDYVEDGTNIRDTLIKYIRANPDEFFR